MTQTELFPERGLLQRSRQSAELKATQTGDLAAALKKKYRAVRSASMPGLARFYAADLSIDRQRPIGVVIPETMDDVIITVNECRQRTLKLFWR